MEAKNKHWIVEADGWSRDVYAPDMAHAEAMARALALMEGKLLIAVFARLADEPAATRREGR